VDFTAPRDSEALDGPPEVQFLGDGSEVMLS
jgi:hypothetical protein